MNLRLSGNTVLCAIVVLAALLSTPMAGSGSIFPVDAIGRLAVDGKYLCTAFPVRAEVLPESQGTGDVPTYRNWLVTAGHCVGSRMVYRQPAVRRRTDQGFITHPARVHVVSSIGFSGRAPDGFDLAVLEYISSYPAPVLDPVFNYQPHEMDKLLSGGYSRGVLYFTVATYLGRNAQGQMIIDGLVSRGNSGGPVLVPGTRQVVGIVVEGTLKLTDTGELACLPWRCQIDRPYKAVPIDWILRVVRW